MRNILFFIIFTCSLLNAQALVGKKYNNGIILKNEALQVEKNKQKDGGILPETTNDMYRDFNLKNDYLCPIKDVSINKHKKWLGFVEYENGEVFAVSSPKYTMAYTFKNPDNIKFIYVTDFESERIIDAKKAFYVFGSRIVSVGGDDIIPFEKEESAKAFLEKNNGKKIFGFDRLDKKLIDYLEMR